jgi:tRNA (cmo5U34)-methyltransferase
LVISSLSIHHLSDVEKQNLFKSIYAHLNPGGIFINADQVLGDTEEIEKSYRNRWVEQVKANGTTEVELEAAFERMKEDKMSTLAAQIQWLKDAGFANTNCWFKHYSFVVFSGTKEKKI